MEIDIQYTKSINYRSKQLVVLELGIQSEEESTGPEYWARITKYWTVFNLKINLEGMLFFAKHTKHSSRSIAKDFRGIECFTDWLEEDDNNYKFKNEHDAIIQLQNNQFPELKRRLDFICEKYGLRLGDNVLIGQQNVIVNEIASLIKTGLDWLQ